MGRLWHRAFGVERAGDHLWSYPPLQIDAGIFTLLKFLQQRFRHRAWWATSACQI